MKLPTGGDAMREPSHDRPPGPALLRGMLFLGVCHATKGVNHE
jgi:hypothetical protein